MQANKERLCVRFLHVAFIGSIRQLAVEFPPRCVRSLNMFVFLKALLELMMSPLIVAHTHFLVSRGKEVKRTKLFYSADS